MPVFSMTPSSFAGYVRARKEYKSISSLGSIDSDGIYLWAGSEPLTIDEAAKSRFDSYRVALVSSGTINVEAAVFAPVGGSTAIVAPTINFGDNTSEVNGLQFTVDDLTADLNLLPVDSFLIARIDKKVLSFEPA